MPKSNASYSGGLFSQSLILFTAVVAFFAGVISAPIFMYLSNNYYDIMLSMGNTRVTLSLLIFWLMLTIIFAVFFDQLMGSNRVPVKVAAKSSRSKPKSKSKRR